MRGRGRMLWFAAQASRLLRSPKISTPTRARWELGFLLLDHIKRSVFLWIKAPALSVARFIASRRTEHRVPHATTCRWLGVSQARFYKVARP